MKIYHSNTANVDLSTHTYVRIEHKTREKTKANSVVECNKLKRVFKIIGTMESPSFWICL